MPHHIESFRFLVHYYLVRPAKLRSCSLIILFTESPVSFTFDHPYVNWYTAKDQLFLTHILFLGAY
nr:hypothetical protein Q903MT_gene3099 [Picea sitchensis]